MMPEKALLTLGIQCIQQVSTKCLLRWLCSVAVDKSEGPNDHGCPEIKVH